jgi:hypothetical protein
MGTSQPNIPANTDAERSILGAILLNNKAFNEASGLIDASDFFLDSHRRIFARMADLAMAEKPIDLVTLIEELERTRDLDAVGGIAYVSSLMDGAVDWPNIEHHAELVKEKAHLRSLLNAAQLVQARVAAGDRPNEVADGLFDAFKSTHTVVSEEPPTTVTPLPQYPAEALDGDYIGELTRVLTDGTSIPPQLTREAIKCILGAILDGHVGFPGYENIHLRHYTLNITTVKRTGKGESWRRTGEAATNGALVGTLADNTVEVVNGGLFGSGEKMTAVLSVYAGKRQQSDPNARVDVLTRFDEMLEPLAKAKTTGSTLEPKLLTLYEENSICSGSFKNGEHRVSNVHFSLIGDFTVDSFEKSFAGSGAGGSGLLARCTFGFAGPIPFSGDWAKVDEKRLAEVITAINLCIDTVHTINKESAGKRFIPEEAIKSKDLRLKFMAQLGNEDPGYVAELPAHFRRDLLLRAVFAKDHFIDEARTQKSILWTQHQLDVRRELWPVDAGWPEERMEQRIVAALQKYGDLSRARLMDRSRAGKPGSGGLELFNRALKALMVSGVLVVAGRTRKGEPVYHLALPNLHTSSSRVVN